MFGHALCSMTFWQIFFPHSSTASATTQTFLFFVLPIVVPFTHFHQYMFQGIPSKAWTLSVIAAYPPLQILQQIKFNNYWEHRGVCWGPRADGRGPFSGPVFTRWKGRSWCSTCRDPQPSYVPCQHPPHLIQWGAEAVPVLRLRLLQCWALQSGEDPLRPARPAAVPLQKRDFLSSSDILSAFWRLFFPWEEIWERGASPRLSPLPGQCLLFPVPVHFFSRRGRPPLQLLLLLPGGDCKFQDFLLPLPVFIALLVTTVSQSPMQVSDGGHFPRKWPVKWEHSLCFQTRLEYMCLLPVSSSCDL